MVGNLNKTQIDELLKTNNFGRIGYQANGRTYITPINYSFDGESIYCISKEGKKLEIMRANPLVCFELDTIKNSCNWESILVWGTFIELKTEEERASASQIIFQNQTHLISSIITHSSATWPFIEPDINKINGVLFKIKLEEKLGKYESCSDAPLFY